MKIVETVNENSTEQICVEKFLKSSLGVFKRISAKAFQAFIESFFWKFSSFSQLSCRSQLSYKKLENF